MDAGGIHIRSLGVADAAPYRALRLESLRNFQFAHGPAYEDALAQSESWHADRLARRDYTWFGAFDGDALVGAICLRAKEGSRLRHSASLNSLMVAQSHQRAGIGRLLTAHLIEHARALGHVRRLTLTLIDGNDPARRLYDAFGFQPFGVEPDAIFHEGGYRAIHHLHLSLVSQATP
ncbi:Ribosomal protein S18 acetylase RimI [Massilia sp. PDC64]|nr:GNAT family N-acetyltransferase [Massilia sp. PDC64]SDC86348.1 Ribosomal protein S18 acetylase RimI [Massilia sp. PDC64]